LEIAVAEMPTEIPRLQTLRDELINGVLAQIPDSRLNGHPTQRLPHNANFSFFGVEGEALLLQLDLHGIAASSGRHALRAVWSHPMSFWRWVFPANGR